ncbi:SAM-dependent methyltransferase [Pleionea sediminis]|uniref:SAM-dependent methyltransferase n=1 Tax=Pleionea sediminis TaxID=2569479 RepID=UPI0011848410|nr:SAM-dependent methyltransferase [Pleionea sediminis]
MSKGRLVIVGTGMITPKHITQEAINHIKNADCVFYITPDALSTGYLKSLNKNLISLTDCYQQTTHRRDAYQLMVDRVMQEIEKELRVVAIFYGHPGVFVTPSHDLMKLSQERKIDCQMLPGISAEDCLFSDLGIDPGSVGCQSYEATFFLLNKLAINTSSPLIIWQLGVVGDLSFSTQIKPASDGMAMLQNKLELFYPSDHCVTLYEAATLPGFRHRAESVPLSQLSELSINDISTLYIPATTSPEPDNDFVNQWRQLQ